MPGPALAVVGSVARFAGRNAGAIGSIVNELKRQVPRIEDEVTVEIVGQPGATKKQLYYLALSTAFGLIRRFDIGFGNRFLATPPGVLMIEYDAADHWIRATVKFSTSMAVAALATGITSGAQSIANVVGELTAQQVQEYLNDQNPAYPVVNLYAQAVVYSGPKDDVVGGPFNFTGQITPGLPSTSTSPGAPKLPFEGQTILTTAGTIKVQGITIPTPNPKPPGDNRSRGAILKRESPSQASNPLDGTDGFTQSPNWNRYLIPMIFDCLTDPGSEFDQTFIPPLPGPTGG